MTWSIRLIQGVSGKLALVVEAPPAAERAVAEYLMLMSADLASDLASVADTDSSASSPETLAQRQARSDILRLARELEEKRNDDPPPESN